MPSAGRTSNWMKITSSAFLPNEKIPAKYTCDGENINPGLTISQVPKEAQSLVLIVDDPDAPNGIFTHWVVFNIPPATVQILENSVPENSLEGTTDFGKAGYGGPCPPSGVHRYFFKLYALDQILNVPEGSIREEVEKAMEGHILEQAQIIGTYGRT